MVGDTLKRVVDTFFAGVFLVDNSLKGAKDVVVVVYNCGVFTVEAHSGSIGIFRIFLIFHHCYLP